MTRGLIFIVLLLTIQEIRGYIDNGCSGAIYNIGAVNGFDIPDGCTEGKIDFWIEAVEVRTDSSKPIKLCVGISSGENVFEVTPLKNYIPQKDGITNINPMSPPACECSSDGKIRLRLHLLEGFDVTEIWYKIYDI